VSAAALRRSARWRQAVRAELALLRDAHVLRWAWLIPLVVPGSPEGHFGGVRTFAWLMFFLPLAWQREQGSVRGNVALPMGGVALSLIRVACGAACASLLLGACIAVDRWSMILLRDSTDTPASLPAWYPAGLFLVGLAQYLFGAAIMLLSERPGRVLVAAFTLGLTLCSATGMWLETTEYRTEYTGDGVIHIARTSLTLATSLLLAGTAIVAVCACAAIGGRGRSGRGHAGLLRWPVPVPIARARSAYAEPHAGSPRGPASLARVAGRQFVLLAPRMGWLLPVCAVAAVFRARNGLSAGAGVPAFLSDSPSYSFLFLAFYWPVLVWMDERGSWEWDAALPCGTVARRLVHAAAGLAWFWVMLLLLLAADVGAAMAAGSLDTPADLPARIWLGLPACALVLYCLGTLCAVLTDRPVLASIFYSVLLPPALVLGEFVMLGDSMGRTPPLPLSPLRALAASGYTRPEYWSGAATLLWSALLVAAACGAIWLRAWWERNGRSPSLREVSRLIRPHHARVPRTS
jgi:hypothetical protein